MNIVVCDDIDGAFQRSGELARLDEGALRVYDTVAEKRATILERLRDTQVAIAIRDRTVFDRETLNALPELRLIAVTAGPHRIRHQSSHRARHRCRDDARGIVRFDSGVCLWTRYCPRTWNRSG